MDSTYSIKGMPFLYKITHHWPTLHSRTKHSRDYHALMSLCAENSRGSVSGIIWWRHRAPVSNHPLGCGSVVGLLSTTPHYYFLDSYRESFTMASRFRRRFGSSKSTTFGQWLIAEVREHNKYDIQKKLRKNFADIEPNIFNEKIYLKIVDVV